MNSYAKRNVFNKLKKIKVDQVRFQEFKNFKASFGKSFVEESISIPDVTFDTDPFNILLNRFTRSHIDLLKRKAQALR